MIKQKKKICKNCGKEEFIFSKGRCKQCSQASYKGLSSTYTTPIKKTTKATQKKRKEQRKDYPEFFKKHIEIILKGKVCEECGSRLKGGVDEVAHIISKSNHPEVATEDKNVLYLCGAFSNNQCHHKFDSGYKKEMKVFKLAKERFNTFKEKLTKVSKESLSFSD